MLAVLGCPWGRGDPRACCHSNLALPLPVTTPFSARIHKLSPFSIFTSKYSSKCYLAVKKLISVEVFLTYFLNSCLNFPQTYSGLFCVSINPTSGFQGIRKKWRLPTKGLRWSEGPPHIFRAAESAFQDMLHSTWLPYKTNGKNIWSTFRCHWGTCRHCEQSVAFTAT